MAETYRRKRRGRTLWDFTLEPGQKVLLRQYIPGKNRLRAVGPLVFLRHMGAGGAEILGSRGKAIRVALANL